MKVLRILLLEDSLLDTELIYANLSNGGIDCELVQVETRTDFVTALETDSFDLILSDYSLPSFDGISALKIARSLCCDVPFIFVSATIGEELAIDTLKNGATDYVVKQRLERLVPSVMRALRESQERSDRKAAEQDLHKSHERLKLLSETASKLLLNDRPQELIENLFQELSSHLGLEVYFNYLVDREKQLLRLNCCGGVSEQVSQEREWLDLGETVCGRVALERHHFVAENVQQSTDPKIEMARSLGMTAYTCHPLLAHGQLMGTLSFGTRNRIRFETDEIELMKVVCDQVAIALERAQMLTRQRQYTSRLQRLAEASVSINSTLSLDEMLSLITAQSREIIGTHQSVTSITVGENWEQAINSVSLSDKYAQWRDYSETTDGSGIYALVCSMKRPMRMTQAELEAHPAWRGFGKAADQHPPMRGWLAVPLIGRNGKNIGLIQLSDKYEGEFTEEDEAILVQMAQMASAAIDNAQLYQESQQANRMKDEFLAILSHELRSPLNPILGWTQLLRTRKFDQATTARAIETIERNAKLQTQLIDDLLDVSRIIRGKVGLNISPINLVSTLEAAIDTVRLAADAKSIQLQSFLDPSVGLVSGDSSRIQQVVWNLLSNAIKFTPEGGRVEIRLSMVSGQKSFANERELMTNEGLRTYRNYAQIQVLDTGKGIRADFLPHVFDYFRQADGSTTRKHGGLGLGLAIVHHLVELHGGTVYAESPGEGQGATFTVILPLIKSEAKKLTMEEDVLLGSESSVGSALLDGVRVLVVDDDTDTREFLTFMLEQYGAEAIAAASAQEAFERIPQVRPDVLVSDIGMPDEDGYSLLGKVRKLDASQGGETPAIALTAYAREEDRTQALSAGFQMHLAKPVEPDELANVVAKLAASTSNR
ncbi:response regulator [Coleofasciculus sp. FACHB-501]|uniref:response regulator n=1 Tax=Cyanophyceae TaxID=3028117 RepID=UPI00168801D9|nr:response regulator [Coleofasciculus sp. FACHB-501]